MRRVVPLLLRWLVRWRGLARGLLWLLLPLLLLLEEQLLLALQLLQELLGRLWAIRAGGRCLRWLRGVALRRRIRLLRRINGFLSIWLWFRFFRFALSSFLRRRGRHYLGLVLDSLHGPLIIHRRR